MDEAWRSPGARPSVVLGGLAPAAIARSAAPVSEGWVAPLFGFEVLRQGVAAARDAWARSGRDGFPRVVTARYFSLGPLADAVADAYLEHYYGPDYFAPARSDTLTSAEGVRAELARLAGAGCTDVVLYPCSGGPGRKAQPGPEVRRHGSGRLKFHGFTDRCRFRRLALGGCGQPPVLTDCVS
jgi:alkanesulfonate monooxygenase SsuD/methylene tetrahydromethanopterin reductase-like flavin-dependent oxidoreductase (luciferase family)